MTMYVKCLDQGLAHTECALPSKTAAGLTSGSAPSACPAQVPPVTTVTSRPVDSGFPTALVPFLNPRPEHLSKFQVSLLLLCPAQTNGSY